MYTDSPFKLSFINLNLSPAGTLTDTAGYVYIAT
jgi:hypothetical protein